MDGLPNDVVIKIMHAFPANFDDPIRILEQIARFMRHDNDGKLGLQGAQEVDNIAPCGPINAGQGLVEDEEGRQRVAHELRREGEASDLAAAEGPGRGHERHVEQADGGEHAAHVLRGLSRPAHGELLEHGGAQEVLAGVLHDNSDVVEHAGRLGQAALPEDLTVPLVDAREAGHQV